MPFNRTENAIQCPGAPKANGNYALVIKHGNVLHLSGWMGQDPKTGKVVEGGAVAQMMHTVVQLIGLFNDIDQEQAIRNIETCLLAAGSSLDKVISRRLFITDMSKVFEVDDAWGRLLKPPYPVSTAIGISSLTQKGAIIELEVTAASDLK